MLSTEHPVRLNEDTWPPLVDFVYACLTQRSISKFLRNLLISDLIQTF